MKKLELNPKCYTFNNMSQFEPVRTSSRRQTLTVVHSYSSSITFFPSWRQTHELLSTCITFWIITFCLPPAASWTSKHTCAREASIWMTHTLKKPAFHFLSCAYIDLICWFFCLLCNTCENMTWAYMCPINSRTPGRHLSPQRPPTKHITYSRAATEQSRSDLSW